MRKRKNTIQIVGLERDFSQDNSLAPAEQAVEVASQNGLRIGFTQSQVRQSSSLAGVNRLLPSTREEGGIGAEQEPLRPSHIERAAEHRFQIERRSMVAHPAIAAR